MCTDVQLPFTHRHFIYTSVCILLDDPVFGTLNVAAHVPFSEIVEDGTTAAVAFAIQIYIILIIHSLCFLLLVSSFYPGVIDNYIFKVRTGQNGNC